MSGTMYLYRLYDDAGQLLYIGISNSPIRRGGEHVYRQPWAYQVKRQEWDDALPSLGAALVAEERAIKAEKPRYNIVHGEAHPVVVEVHKGVLPADETNGVTDAMGCPLCGFYATHIVSVDAYSDGRPAFALYGNCENGCYFLIRFTNYKGSTIVNIEAREPCAADLDLGN